MAIMWLLAGYNVDLRGKSITIVGNGRLVGKPLKAMFDVSDIDAVMLNGTEKNPADILLHSQIIITAVGKPGLINSAMIPLDCVVVDAAVASENGELKGDLADDVYERDDIKVTPRKGGVGPLTVVALFDNVIRAAKT
jgi:methylenetetrahydrofolate dehydrogenase (NADP+)/methenyltetrahydrofolate cyclohydrolase